MKKYERFYKVVQKIPPGKVATYGQIAFLAGLPGHARQVGYALHALPPQSRVPWHRVVNARGEISLPDYDGSAGQQRALLEAEGVIFKENGRIPLRRFQWQPGDFFPDFEE